MAGSGIRVFASGEILTAAQVNGYLMDQTVTRFADAATRDAAFGGVGQPALDEGRICYLDDVNLIQFFDGATWVDSAQFTVGDGTISNVKLAANSVTSDKIAPGTVIAADIAAGTITATELADGAVTSGKILNDTIVNADINSSAAIADTKLATISTAGKVSNSATTATDANTASAIVARDASGNFVAGKATLATADVTTVIEMANIVSASANGTINIDFNTNPTVYYTGNASADWTLNVRGTSSVSLNDTISTGQIATVTFLATIGTTQRRPTVFQVDGSAITPKWMGGAAPTIGNASSIDAYTLAIIKTGSAAFTMLASQTRFA
jgi:hypothetical protein